MKHEKIALTFYGEIALLEKRLLCLVDAKDAGRRRESFDRNEIVVFSRCRRCRAGTRKRRNQLRAKKRRQNRSSLIIRCFLMFVKANISNDLIFLFKFLVFRDILVVHFVALSVKIWNKPLFSGLFF